MKPSDDTPIYLILGATGAVGSTLARTLSARGACVVVDGGLAALKKRRSA